MILRFLVILSFRWILPGTFFSSPPSSFSFFLSLQPARKKLMEGEKYSSPSFAHVAGSGLANFPRRHPRVWYGACRRGGSARRPRRRDSRPRNDAVSPLHVRPFVTQALILNEIWAGHGQAVRGRLPGRGSELGAAAGGTLFISIDFRLITFNLPQPDSCRGGRCGEPATRRGLGRGHGHLSDDKGTPKGRFVA